MHFANFATADPTETSAAEAAKKLSNPTADQDMGQMIRVFVTARKVRIVEQKAGVCGLP
jgi:hypothetical protein